MSDDGVYIYKNIVIKKTDSMSHISINVKGTEGAFEYKSTFTNCFKSCSPNLIKMQNIEPMTGTYAMLTADSLKQIEQNHTLTALCKLYQAIFLQEPAMKETSYPFTIPCL